MRYDFADYYLFKNGRWGFSERYQGYPVDHFDLEKPDSGRDRYSLRGRYRGNFGRATKALVRLGLVSAADAEVVRSYIFDLDKLKQDKSTKRDLEWRARQLGVKLVYPKRLLDDSKLKEPAEEAVS